MHVVIFEGSHWTTFAPLALSRPVFMLASGMSTLLEKQLRYLEPTRLTLWVRPEFEAICRKRIIPRLSIPADVNTALDDEPALIVSGRTMHFSKYEYPGEPAINVDENQLVHSAHVQTPGLSPADVINRTERWMSLMELPHMMPQSRMVESLWDLIGWNEESLVADSTRLLDCPRPRIDGPVHVINESDVCQLGERATLEPGVVLDASNGPVVISDHAHIGANSVLKGPCFIGEGAHLRPLTLIRPGTSIGPMCRVGGEVSRSIILGYSNKSHDGYLGDSYVGKWVNLGAGTTTSNLKNTYGEISIRMGDREVPTGRRNLGAVIGDHTKTAILTRLMTGTYVGFCCQLAGSSMTPRFVSSYSYWTDRGMEQYRIDKAIEVTRRVYARRDRPWTDLDEGVMRYVAETAPEVENTQES